METNLTVDFRDRPGSTVLIVRGELDMASSPQLAAALKRLDPGSRAVLLDLSRLEFIDVTGLRVLLDAQERARRAGVALRVVKANRGVRKLLKLTRTMELLGD
jgi:anti-sigma B factor antagonist